MRTARLAVVALVAACSRNPPPPPPPAAHDASLAKLEPAGDAGAAAPEFRSESSTPHLDPGVTGHGKTFMVASESAQASAVGKQVLASGGNAVDAAVATAFALEVVHPTAGNLAGGGFAVIRLAPGKAATLDFRETAPAAATQNMFLDASGTPTNESIVGYRASGVPGSVAGLWALHQKYGKKPWAELVEPAIGLARNGFQVDAVLHTSIERGAKRIAKFPTTAAIWTPNGIAREAGATVAIPELASVLERIRDHGADGFYKGDTAHAIAAAMKAGGGLITEADLASYQVIWRDPIRFGYRGDSVIAMPPPSSGGVVLAMVAGMLRKVDLAKLGWHSVEHVHELVEIWRRAFVARNELLGDPGFVKDMPVARLISQDYVDRLAATIGPGATKSTDVVPLLEGNHTTNLSVVDGSGMAVALTTTLNTSFGSCVTVSGFLMNNEMDDFSIKPGAANAFGLVQGEVNKIEPGKRMLSSMSPTIVEDPHGQVILVAGAGGGPRIVTAVWQTISNVVDFGDDADTAVALPRIHHQHLPDMVFVEAQALDRATDEKLRAMGYALNWSIGPREFGAVTAIVRTKNGWDGTADPRGGGGATGD